MATEIYLSNNHVALIDDEVSDIVGKHKWQACAVKNLVYASRHVGKTKELLHHFLGKLWGWTFIRIDHKDHNSLNNTKDNLRPCTQSQNLANARMRSDNTSGFRGVIWDQQRGRYRAELRTNGKTKHLGRYLKAEDAARVRDAAAMEAFGEFATLNFP